jgi:hypothetical protein
MPAWVPETRWRYLYDEVPARVGGSGGQVRKSREFEPGRAESVDAWGWQGGGVIIGVGEFVFF